MTNPGKPVSPEIDDYANDDQQNTYYNDYLAPFIYLSEFVQY